ncbi:uncharacterized protein LOC129940324 [Eupeodes corollae]|uniref:uncharacterized protein LOC129940324 n=1 Tax=Eupeodes corollae TaxID=290404 RepID=UPI002491178B|nr:uncharacterized protein LOC129940324 [Eupeodes corollae]
MIKVLLSFFAIIVIASAGTVPRQYSNEAELPQSNIHKNGITGRGYFLSSKGKQVVENFVAQFENGYSHDNMTIDFSNSVIGSEVTIENLLVMGLDNVEIKKLDIGYTLSQSVKFNFLLPKVDITGKVLTNLTIDALSKLGLKLNGNVHSDAELVLQNVTFQGYFKYKMPFVFGSVKIYKFEASIQVGNIVSKIDGLMGNGLLNQLLNSKIEKSLLQLVNSSKGQTKISTLLRDTLVPFANSKFEGSNIWTILG